MIFNTFSSQTFTSIWLKHFGQGKQVKSFKFLNDIDFVKHGYLPIYINIGRNHTKGFSYGILDSEINELHNGVVIIYDVHEYDQHRLIKGDTKKPKPHIKIDKIKQYPGYLIELDKYKDFEDFIHSSFSKKSRSRFRNWKIRLEQAFEIEHKMYYGTITKDEYNHIFGAFRRLLEKRFGEKKIKNNNLESDEWDFYFEVAYPMILEKKAGLFVTYENKDPVAISLLFFDKQKIIDAIVTFDIDFSKFRLGYIFLNELIKWAMENKIQYFDFSKGHFDYKNRWGDSKYDFSYHVIHNPKSITSVIISRVIKTFFNLKLKLRDFGVNNVLHKITYLIKIGRTSKNALTDYMFLKPNELNGITREDFVFIGGNDDKKIFKKVICDFLYKYPNETLADIEILKDHNNGFFLLKGNASEEYFSTKPK